MPPDLGPHGVPNAPARSTASSSRGTASPRVRSVLVGQRIRGLVAVIDAPAGPESRVYRVERAVPSQAELEGLVAEYCARGEAAGMPAILASRGILDEDEAASRSTRAGPGRGPARDDAAPIERRI